MISLSFVGDNIGEYYSTEDYYQSQKSGELIGQGVEAFEFDPSQHQHEQFMSLVGDRVGVQKKNGDYQQPRKALDMTFSSPKSVSILYGLAIDAGDHALAEKVLDNHTRAVKKAFEHLESEDFFQTLIKFEDGVQKYKATDIVAEVVPTHLTSRDGQAQVHTHLLIANKCHAVDDPSGQERAVDFGAIFNNQKYIDAVVKQYEAQGLEDMGFAVEQSRNKKGVESFRIAGITREDEKIYSNRRVEIEKNIEERLGKSIDQATAKEREQANKATRKSKEHEQSLSELNEKWQSDHEKSGLSLNLVQERNREFAVQREAEQSARYAEQQQQQYQAQQYQQQQYQQQQANQAERYQRQQASNQAAQQRQEADRRRTQERRAQQAKAAHAKAQAEAEASRPHGTRDLSYSGQPKQPEAAPRPELERDFGGFSHGDLGSHGRATSMPDWPKTAAPSHRASYQLTAWECSVLTQRAGYEQYAKYLPPDWRYLPETRRAELREILDLPREGHPETRPMVWHTGLENAVLPDNWLNMTDPEREAWRRDQLSHDPGREATAPDIQPQTPTRAEIEEAARQELLEDLAESDQGPMTEAEVDAYLKANMPDRVATLERLAGVQPQPEATPTMAAEPSGINIIDTPAAPLDPKKEAVRAALTQCEEMRGVWSEMSAYNESRKIAIDQGIALTLDDFRNYFNELKEEAGVKDLAGQDQSYIYRKFASSPVLDAEQYVMDLAARNKSIYDAPILDSAKAREFLDDYAAKRVAAGKFAPNQGQTDAFLNIVNHSQDFSIVLQGRAGTGKTTGVMRPLVEFVGPDHVQGLSTGAAAAKQLGDAAGCESRTIASFLKRVEKGDADTIARITNGYILIDEAGMVSAADMAAVKKVALAHGARLVELGDTDQLPPVGAGKPFAMVIERHAAENNYFDLREIVRQKNDAGINKEATGALINLLDDKTKEALQYFVETDQLEVIKDKNERYKAIIAQKIEGMAQDADEGLGFTERKHDYLTQISTNTAREKINNGVRKEMKAVGLLPQDQDVTLSVADRDGVLTEKRFCPGDHIVFLQNNNDVGVQNSNLAQIQSIDKDSNTVTALLEDGSEVSFDAQKYNRFDHGYALTTYKAQGATRCNVQYDADSKSPLMSLNEFYVGASRHERNLIIWTDNKKKLANKIGKHAEKQSPLEEQEKGQARENGHPYVEAVEKAHEARKSADQDTKEKQRRLAHSYQGDYRRVPREFRDLIDQEFESHRKQFASDLDAAKARFGDKKDSVTRDMNISIDKWKENQQKIKVDGYRAEAEAKKKGAITKEERQAKKDAGHLPEWQKEWLQRDPDARARAEHQKLVNAARRSHQSLDTRLASMHAANDKALEKKLTEYTPRRQLADELARREELAATKSSDLVIAAKDRPAHLAAEAKSAAVFQAIREAEAVQKETVKQIAADQREARAKAEKEKQDFGPEQRKPFIEKYQAANAAFRASVQDAVTKHCDSPEAGQAIHDALDRWQRGQDGIKKASTQNVKQYIKIRDRKQPAPSKVELSKAKAEFEKENERVKKLYKANKAALDKTFANIKQFIKEEELRKYYESQGRTAPEPTIKPIRSRDAEGKETVSFRSPDQSQRKTRAEREIGDLVSEYRSITEKPKHPFMRDLAATRAAWEADRRAINGDKAKELEQLQAKDPAVKELDGERAKHYRERHSAATSKFKARVEELTAKHGGDKATVKKVMASLRAWESRKSEIRKQSSALYREKDGKPRKPTPEEKAGIVEKYRHNDGMLDKEFDGIRKELDTKQKELKKAKKLGKELITNAKTQSPEKLQNEKNELAPEAPRRDPKQVAAAVDKAIRADEDKFFAEIDAAVGNGVRVNIPDRKAQVQGVLVGTLKGKDGKNYAIIASGNGNYSAVPATGDIRSMLGKPVLAGRNGIAVAGSPTPGSNEINKFMLCRPIVAKQFGAKLGKMMQRLMDNGRDMELLL